METRITLPALAACAAAFLAGAGCTTEFGSQDADADGGDTAVDPGVDTGDTSPDTTVDPPHDTTSDTEHDDGPIEVSPTCGDGTIQGGEECEGETGQTCVTDCGLEGFISCDPLTCTWIQPCRTTTEICDNGCDDDADGMANCADPDCTTSTACICTDDSMEPNDSMGEAVLMTNGTHAGLRSCAGNDDFYRFATVLPTTAVAQVLFSQAEGDLDLSFADASGTVMARSESTDDDEQVTVDLPALGQYYVRVYMYTDLGFLAGNDYTIILSY